MSAPPDRRRRDAPCRGPVRAKNVILLAELGRSASRPDAVPPRGATAAEPVLPTVGSCVSAAGSSVEGSSSLNTFVQVKRTDDVFGTHRMGGGVLRAHESLGTGLRRSPSAAYSSLALVLPGSTGRARVASAVSWWCPTTAVIYSPGVLSSVEIATPDVHPSTSSMCLS